MVYNCRFWCKINGIYIHHTNLHIILWDIIPMGHCICWKLGSFIFKCLSIICWPVRWQWHIQQYNISWNIHKTMKSDVIVTKKNSKNQLYMPILWWFYTWHTGCPACIIVMHNYSNRSFKGSLGASFPWEYIFSRGRERRGHDPPIKLSTVPLKRNIALAHR